VEIAQDSTDVINPTYGLLERLQVLLEVAEGKLNSYLTKTPLN
jgi:hypothetical protein